MPRRSKGAYRYLMPPRRNKATGAVTEASSWIIRDGTTYRRTGCAPEDVAGAEQALQRYLVEKYQVDRTPERGAAAIEVADVLNIYAQDKVAGHGRPQETVARMKALSAWWGGRMLADVSGVTCRAYAATRPSQASARRELEDFRAAINHHRKEGLCREMISVVLPDKSEPRETWLTRSEAARLIKAAYRYREVQKGHATGRRSRLHVARFILLGIYTGTRAGAICSAAFEAGPGQGFLDLDAGVFYRKRQGAKTTNKRQPPVRLPDRVLAHLRRWKRTGTSRRFAVEFNGKPIGKINKAFARAAKDAGLGSAVTPHVLRHTAATWVMHSGVDISQAAGLIGMTVEMLERVYGHHHPDFQRAAADGISGRRRTVSARENAKQTRT